MPAVEYPDVLGAISTGPRQELETFQCASGVYPGRTMLGQPFEVLILLQSTIDQPQEVALALQLPRRDAAGRELNFSLPRQQVRLRLAAGEVGMAHLPVIARPPTPPAPDYPLIVRLAARVSGRARRVRGPGAGSPPAYLSIPPVRLAVFQSIAFCGEGAPGALRCRFSVMDGLLQPESFTAAPKYETLWTPEHLAAAQEALDLAEQKAASFTAAAVAEAVEERTRAVYAAGKLPLHPAEAWAIVRAILHAYAAAPHDTARWFERLGSLLRADAVHANRHPADLAMHDLYFPALYDAALAALPRVAQALGEDYGTPDDQRAEAERLLQTLQSGAPLALSHAYVPLVFGGVLLLPTVLLPEEIPSATLERLQEARRARALLYAGQHNPLLLSLDRLIADVSRRLR